MLHIDSTTYAPRLAKMKVVFIEPKIERNAM